MVEVFKLCKKFHLVYLITICIFDGLRYYGGNQLRNNHKTKTVLNIESHSSITGP